MNGEKLLECLEFLDDDLITEGAASPKKAKARAGLLRNAAFAASFVLLLGAAFLLPKLLLHPDTPITPVSTTLTDVPSTTITPIAESTVSTALTAEPEQPLSPEMQDKITALNQAIGGGDTIFNRKYQDETYNLAYLRTVHRGEVPLLADGALDAWVNEVFLQKSAAEQDALPTLYQAIRDLSISKEDLVVLNESRKARGSSMALADSMIDALYLEDTEEMKKALAHPLALCYNCNIYTWQEFVQNKDSLLLPESVVEAYIARVETYCRENGIETYFHRTATE